MKPLLVKSFLVSCLLIIVILAACKGGSPKTNNESPPARSATEQVSSSADVVKITAPEVSVNAGSSVDVEIKLAIRPGYHVNANPPTFPYLIPTEITAGKSHGIIPGKAVYPSAEKRKFQFADQPLAVYEGDARIVLPLSVDHGATRGRQSLPITLRVQACDEQQCFPPVTLNATIQIEVK